MPSPLVQLKSADPPRGWLGPDFNSLRLNSLSLDFGRPLPLDFCLPQEQMHDPRDVDGVNCPCRVSVLFPERNGRLAAKSFMRG